MAFGGGPGGPTDACFSCHGLKGEGDGGAPRLAGQTTGYLVKQMEDYAGDWRQNEVMTSVARRLGDADRLAVSVYYAGLPGLEAEPGGGAGMLWSAGDPGRGIAPCASCHEGAGAGLAGPRLGGQTPAYVRSQLTAWKASTRRNDPQDVMGRIARALTDEEIDALARDIGAGP